MVCASRVICSHVEHALAAYAVNADLLHACIVCCLYAHNDAACI